MTSASEHVSSVSRPGDGTRFEALDSWRGICALAVALFHFPVLGEVRSFPLVANAFLFVDFFFVLSGFVIAWAFENRLADDKRQVWPFVVRRFGRLWPLHAFVLAIFVVVNLAQGDLGQEERHSVAAIWTNLVLIHGLGVHETLTWNGPSWSISVEFFLYLMFAALTAIPWRRWIYVALIVGSLAVLAFRAPYGMASTFDYGLFRGLAGFFTGALISRLPLRRYGLGAELASVVLVGLFVAWGEAMFLAPVVFGLAIHVFAGAAGPFSAALRTRPALALGDWSYSIYMVHSLVVAAIWAVHGPLGLTRYGQDLESASPWADLLALPYLAAVVGISALTFRFVEAPARAYFNGLAVRLRQRPA